MFLLSVPRKQCVCVLSRTHGGGSNGKTRQPTGADDNAHAMYQCGPYDNFCRARRRLTTAVPCGYTRTRAALVEWSEGVEKKIKNTDAHGKDRRLKRSVVSRGMIVASTVLERLGERVCTVRAGARAMVRARVVHAGHVNCVWRRMRKTPYHHRCSCRQCWLLPERVTHITTPLLSIRSFYINDSWQLQCRQCPPKGKIRLLFCAPVRLFFLPPSDHFGWHPTQIQCVQIRLHNQRKLGDLAIIIIYYNFYLN